MELKELIGKHTLLGVDFYNAEIEIYDDYKEEAEHCLFELDSGTYLVVEDPDDGYRSHIRDIQKVDAKVKNRFYGEPVVARKMPADTDSHWHQENDAIEFVSAETGKVVLTVGTQNTDDYYPYFVASFSPENMSINATVHDEQIRRAHKSARPKTSNPASADELDRLTDALELCQVERDHRAEGKCTSDKPTSFHEFKWGCGHTGPGYCHICRDDQMERWSDALAQAQQQIGSLQAKVHLCAGYDKLESRVQQLEAALHAGDCASKCDHDLVTPEDSQYIKWGQSKICIKCEAIFKPDGSVFMKGREFVPESKP